MTDAEHMARWFMSATKPQLAHYNQRMSDAAPYRNTPKWDRMRDHATRHFEYETTEARQIYQRAMSDLEVFGEVSEETDVQITQFQVAEIFAQAAE